MWKTVILITFIVAFSSLAVCQVTPDDIASMETKLKQWEIQLQNEQKSLDKEADQQVTVVVEKIRQQGNYKAFFCAEKQAAIFIRLLYKNNFSNLLYEAIMCEKLINGLNSGTISEKDIEDLKNLIDNGDYDSMVKQKIELSEKYYKLKLNDFQQSAEQCTKNN